MKKIKSQSKKKLAIRKKAGKPTTSVLTKLMAKKWYAFIPQEERKEIMKALNLKNIPEVAVCEKSVAKWFFGIGQGGNN